MFDVDLGPRMKITESDLNQHGDTLTTAQTGINMYCLTNIITVQTGINLYYCINTGAARY